MPLDIPKTAEIIARNLANLESQLNQTAPQVSKAFLKVLAAMDGMNYTELYKLGLERILQVLALTATEEDLDLIGNNYGVFRSPAEATILSIEITATGVATVLAGTEWVGDSNQERYRTNTELAFSGAGTDHVNVTAINTGVAGNLTDGELLTINAPITNIVSSAEVDPDPPATSGTVNLGVERETDEAYRRRVLTEIRTVGGGGNAVDYRTWAEATAGVLRAFPYAGAPLVEDPAFKDGDCETAGVADWTANRAAVLTKDVGAPQSGTQNLRVAHGGTSNPYASQSVLQQDIKYQLTGYGKGDGTYEPSIRINGGSCVMWTGTSAATWQAFDITFWVPDSDPVLRFRGNMTGAGWVEFDTMELIRLSLPGDRTVFIESTIAIDADGIPPQTLLDDARENINTNPDTGQARPPLGETDGTLFVEPITRTEFYVEVVALDVDAGILAETQAKIETAVGEYFRSIVPFVESIDTAISQNNVITRLTIAQVVQDILNTVGGSAEEVNFGLDGVTFALDSYILGQGEMAKLFTPITWTP